MEIVKKFDNLVEIHYSSKRDQVDQLCSIGVFLEDPIFQGKIMDMKEIRKKNRPVLHYDGFNFSSQDLKNYVSKNNSSLEAKLLENLNQKMGTKKEYYVITCLKDDTSTYNHEMAHYEFWNDPKIQFSVNKLLSRGAYDSLSKNMEKLGYHKSVIQTEIYAFSKVFENSLPMEIKKDLLTIKKQIFQ